MTPKIADWQNKVNKNNLIRSTAFLESIISKCDMQIWAKTFTLIKIGEELIIIKLSTVSQTDAIYKKLLQTSEDLKNFKVYTKDNILPRWHMYNEQRFGPIIVVAEDNYAFDDMWIFAEAYKKKLNVSREFLLNKKYIFLN